MNMDKVTAIMMVTTISLFTRKKKVIMMNTNIEIMNINKLRAKSSNLSIAQQSDQSGKENIFY